MLGVGMSGKGANGSGRGGEVTICRERGAVRVTAGSKRRKCCGECRARLRLLVWLEGRGSVCVEAFAALHVGQGGCHVGDLCAEMGLPLLLLDLWVTGRK